MSSNPARPTVLLGTNGERVATIYDFDKAGDILGQNAHEYGVNDHYTVIAKGRFKVSSGPQSDPANYWETEHGNGPVLDHKPLPGQTHVVHQFEALEDGSRVINIRKGFTNSESVV
jgi:hypothetical protein